ncbi:MAG: nucleotide exchange factor GrpE [Salinivenus sp.]
MSTNATNGSQTSEDTADAPDSTEDPAADDHTSNDEHTEDLPEGLEARVEELEAKVEALEDERDELNERLLRKAAEFDNYRRRMEREKKRRYRKGKLDVIEPLLEVVDDFERSMDAAQDLDEAQDAETAYESLKGGVEMVFRKFQDALETLGVKPIEAEGHAFDENLHEAMMRQPTNDAEPGTVLHEIRKGYRLDDHIVRHSRVVVAAEDENA